MQVTSNQSNPSVPATAPLPVEAAAACEVACEEKVAIAKDALVQSKAEDKPVVEEAVEAVESLYNWTLGLFNLQYPYFFRGISDFFSRREEEELKKKEEARIAGLDRQAFDRRAFGRRRDEQNLQTRLQESMRTVKAVEEAHKFHQAVDQLTRRPA